MAIKEDLSLSDRRAESIDKNNSVTSVNKGIQGIQEKTDMYEYLFENANDGIVFLDNEAVIRASNKKIEDLFGYQKEEIVGRPFTQIPVFDPDDMVRTFQLFIDTIEGKLPPLIEFKGIHKNGRRFYLEINPTVIKQDEDTIGILAILRDTTARKRLEQERARLIDIIEATPDFVFTYDADNKISYINRAGLERLGLESTDGLTMADLHRIPVTSPEEVEKGIWSGESRIRLKDGTRIHVAHVVMEHCQKNMNEPFYSMIMKDMTSQKQKENHIKYLTRYLMKVQEDERARISRDLHDNLAQDLSTLKIRCESLFDNHDDIPESIQKKISGMSMLFKKSIESVREIAYNLRPSNLLELGLVKALGKFCEELKDDGLDITFFSAGMNHVTLDFDTEINLFRIVQETFSNIKKHARASRVALTLVSSYPKIILKIEDDGMGFDVEKRKKELIYEKRMGLTSIEERVCLLNGTFRIKSKIGVGTLMHVEIPIPESWDLKAHPIQDITTKGQTIPGLEQEA